MLSACASPHVLPRLKPLFGGLDESQVPVAARLLLAHAKQDFALARHGREPVNARPAGVIPHTHSRVFEGDGYRLTMVNNDLVNVLLVGPEIVLDGRITNGGPYRYDEIDRIED
ncbi:MAG: hypothetical protein JWO94_3986 [Verrucomicrobiaceae bacterium]|nr:hypothetical protein [Verrucomicrobiaceae bacterium]